MTRLLLLGGQGQIGRALERVLKARPGFTALSRAELDIADERALRRRLLEIRPGLVINAAAWTAVDKAEQEPEACARVNAQAPGWLARETADMNCALVHFSTDYVFDGTGERPWREDDAAQPVNAYGRAKLAGEQAIRSVHPAHLILRTSWIYDAQGSNFLQTMLRLMGEREELRVVADQFGAPTSADAVADAVAAILDKAGDAPWNYFRQKGGTVNCACDGVASWHGFAEAILAEAGRRGWPLAAKRILPIASRDYPLPAKRPLNSRLSLARLETEFGLRMPNWRAALERVFDEMAPCAPAEAS